MRTFAGTIHCGLNFEVLPLHFPSKRGPYGEPQILSSEVSDGLATFCLFCFMRQVLTMYYRQTWNSLSSCLSLSSAGITSVYQYTSS
jgi:hypothetical protein